MNTADNSKTILRSLTPSSNESLGKNFGTVGAISQNRQGSQGVWTKALMEKKLKLLYQLLEKTQSIGDANLRKAEIAKIQKGIEYVKDQRVKRTERENKTLEANYKLWELCKQGSEHLAKTTMMNSSLTKTAERILHTVHMLKAITNGPVHPSIYQKIRTGEIPPILPLSEVAKMSPEMYEVFDQQRKTFLISFELNIKALPAAVSVSNMNTALYTNFDVKSFIA